MVGRAIQLVNGLLLSAILVRRFGLEVVGSFALGIAAVNVLATVCALGLGAYLPRAEQSHGQSCFAALALFSAQLPIVVPLLAGYAALEARSPAEWQVIFVVALSGFFIGLQNLGMMLSIMVRRFHPGLWAPLCETAGLVGGACLCASAPGLAMALLAARVGSVAIVWSGFRFEPLPLARVLAIGRTGAVYLAPDVLGILGEQAAPLLLGSLVSRGDLGIFRLCQQLLMASDSPCWTFVQSKYPEMVERGPAFVEEVHAQVRRIGLFVTAGCALGSALLAYVFFDLPILALLMTVLSAAVLWRYKTYLFGQALRAAGHVGAVTGLGAARLVLALGLLGSLSNAAGLWGAVFALALLSLLSGLAYERVYRARLEVAHDGSQLEYRRVRS
jgi:O-antigen/teichoic acid export membrane protein